MNRVTVIPADGYVAVDGRGISGLDLSALDPQIHAVQWYGATGQVELVPDENGRGYNIEITSLEMVQPALDAWQAAVDAIDNPPPPSVAYSATARIATLSAACEDAITSGFTSSALGAPHTYQSDRDDQTNLLGSHATAIATGQSVPHKCRDGASVWAYRLHTPAQMTQVLADGAATKLGHLQRFGLLRDQVWAIVAANTLLPDDPDYLTDDAARAAIDAVVWAE